MEAILIICTLLGGITAAWFLIEKIYRKENNALEEKELVPYFIGPKKITIYESDKDNYLPEFDNILKIRDEKLFERLNKIRKIVIPELLTIPADEFCGDTYSHVREVLRLLVALYPKCIKHELSNQELFILATFCLVHDWGMIPPGNVDSATVYKKHGEYSATLVCKRGLPLNFNEKNEICALCEIHNKEISLAQIRLQELTSNNRLLLIYSMFRIADCIEIKLQAPSLAGASSIEISKVLGTFRIDNRHKIIYVTKNINMLNSEKFNIVIKQLSGIIAECNTQLKKVRYKYSLKIEN